MKVFSVITGVSGSGKSTLLKLFSEAIKEAIRYKGSKSGENYRDILGTENIQKVIEIDQKPIGRTSRSNPATYTKVWDIIRDLFANQKESKVRGYTKSRFSFNTKGGSCEECGGAGTIQIEMKMFSNVDVICEVCLGKRFNLNTLDIYYKGKNIYDILEMNIKDAKSFFSHIGTLNKVFTLLDNIGLGYLKLGQPSTTLSGGEAQRIKIASEIRKSGIQKNLYLLDEVTTGLHFNDIIKLKQSIDQLVEQGNTVILIEHNLEIIKCADYIIELGPLGGEKGGEVIFTGTPEMILTKNTPTAIALKRLL